MELDEPCCVGTSLTKEQWIDVLTDEKVTNQKNISILKELYVCEEHKSSAGKIAPILGYETHAPLNGIIGSWGRRVVKKIPYRLIEKTYGEIGKKFIHIHHLVKISDIKEEYMIDPIEDLRPVCPNCHAMLHKKEPPFTIEELKGMLNID